MSKKKVTPADIQNQIQRDLESALAGFKRALAGLGLLTAMTAVKAGAPIKQEAKTVKPAKPAKKAKPTAKAKPQQPAAETIPTVVAEPAPEKQVRRRTPASVRLTPHEVTLNIGAHPVRALAENDAKDFLGNPRVFWYRAMQFPDPRRYQVQPHVENVRVVKRVDKRFENAPWTCSVTVTLVGDSKRCQNWGLALYTKNKGEQE